ncbi:MAG: ATP-binding protein [Candidatus Omnitrophota bacterium]
MNEDKITYKQHVAFINRTRELRELKTFIDKEPSEILFIHGPKSSGKTTLLYKFLEQVEKEQHLDVKFLNLRETFTHVYEDFLNVFFNVRREGEKKESAESNINVGFFKISSAIEKKILEKRVDPFKIMKAELIRLHQKGIKPVLIIDELQALDYVYIDNDKERLLIIALFNFFVAVTKESHLAYVIVASSDGYFLNTIYNDSRLKKTSIFYKVDYLNKDDLMNWLLNLKKYSGIDAYALTPDDAEKIWDTVGGSMWEVQHILTELFEKPIDSVLESYKKKMKGIVSYYAMLDKNKRELLTIVNQKGFIRMNDLEALTIDEQIIRELLRDMVRNNILYFDPAEAIYYPQGKSVGWGIRLYLEDRKKI